MSSLKPCAHCGSKNIEIKKSSSHPFDNSYYVQCNYEDCYMHTAYCNNQNGAISIWNKRVKQENKMQEDIRTKAERDVDALTLRIIELERHISLINHLDGAKRDMQGEIISLALNIDNICDRLSVLQSKDLVDKVHKLEVSAGTMDGEIDEHTRAINHQAVRLNKLSRDIKALEDIAKKYDHKPLEHALDASHYMTPKFEVECSACEGHGKIMMFHPE